MKVLESLGYLHRLHSSSLGGTEIELTPDSLRGPDIIDCPYDVMGHADRTIHTTISFFFSLPSYITFNKIKAVFTGGGQIPQTAPN